MAKADNTHVDIEGVLSPKAKDSLKKLEIFARRIAEGMLHGIHPSKRKGVSTEFDHHKQYAPGDPIKHIDWKVTARQDRYFIKKYLEDTSLAARIILDRSASMLMSTDDSPSKDLQASRLAACLAYLIVNQGDSVGMIMSSGKGADWHPVSSTQTKLINMLRSIVTFEPEGSEPIQHCIKQLVDRGERKGLVMFISDLSFDPKPVQAELAKLQSQGHEVLIFQLKDQTEEEFPFNRWVLFKDLENSAVTHKIEALTIKRLYLEEYAAVIKEWEDWAKKYNVHMLSWRTEEPIETVLSEYIAYRTGQLKGSA